MRVTLNVIGLLLALFGIVWILQGLDVVGAAGFMAGQNKWAIVGAAVLVAAIVVLTSANRRRA
jgi:hypothetical protein